MARKNNTRQKQQTAAKARARPVQAWSPVVTCTISRVDIQEGEDFWHVLDVQQRPFDDGCKEIVSLNGGQVATLVDVCPYWCSWRQWKEGGPPVVAYELLRTAFIEIAHIGEDHLQEYTIEQVVYCINHALGESSIPIPLLNAANKTHVWRQRYELLAQPRVLSYWHEQEKAFLTKKRQYDETPNADPKEDPWRYFLEYGRFAFVPDRNLQAAYLVLGATLDGAASMMLFFPWEVRKVYPEFFYESVTRADGSQYAQKISIVFPNKGAFFETLWIQVKNDLEARGLFDGTSAVESKPDKTAVTLDDFMDRYCETEGYQIESKRDLLLKQNREGKIALPERVDPGTRGYRATFYAEDLLDKWPTYLNPMPTLPPLKVQKSAS